MSYDKEYICVDCATEFDDDELAYCPHCNKKICPETYCYGEIITLEEYHRNKKINHDDEAREDKELDI